MSFILISVGKTHSGKTSFGQELVRRLGPCCLLDSDEVADFLKAKYPDLYQQDYEQGTYEPNSGYHLKIAVLLDVYKAALKTDLPIIFTSANATKQIRQAISCLAKENGRSTILVYFNLTDDVLLERINNSQRLQGDPVDIKKFKDFLLNIQNRRFEVPTAQEADYYFELNSTTASQEILPQVVDLMAV